MMSPQHFHSPNSYLLSTTTNPLIVIIVSIIISSSYCGADDDRFTNCSRPYNCGDIQGVRYPFWGGDRPEFCGRPDLGLDCDHNKYSNLITGKRIQPTYNQIYRVLNINQSDSAHTMTIVPKDLFNNICPKILPTSKPILNYSLGNYAENVRQLRIFYGCRSEITGVLSNFKCTVKGSEADGVIFAKESVTNKEGCLMNIVVPVVKTAYDELWDGTLTLLEALNQGYDVDYKAYHPVDCSACADSGGICGSDSELQFLCFCPDKPYTARCPSIKKHGINRRLKLIIGASVSGSGILCICMIICCCRFRKSSDNSILFWMKKKKKDQDLEALIRHLALKRYSYSDIKKMTNAFRDKLGQGGYGDVYKGILLHGRHPVAVKILKESKGNGEEFINEVVSISRTSHVNVVTLLGFCLEGHKRALIYDFMPNGSLEKYILYGQIPQKSTGGQLGWEKLYQISVGIARGLEYLHRGCNTRILHFDIKPHNILLDEDFCPKISDFGLAKLCSRKESIVSMLEARGTIGYIAPEVFSRNFGGVSSKSDVYSYGMMVLEMVGGRKNIYVGVSRTSKIYFPQWVYSRLELDEDLELQDIIVQEEYENARKMILVGLWCIQTDPSQRPSMNKVIDMLEGRMEDLHIPPKPFL